jgi:hypothetical protein
LDHYCFSFLFSICGIKNTHHSLVPVPNAYDKNSESDYFFFPPPKSEYFFQQHWESEYFFLEKNHTPSLEVKWSVPKYAA